MSRLLGLGRWLAEEAPHSEIGTLFPAFCEELVRRGLPVWRCSLGLEVLHPEVSGWLHIWTNAAITVRESSRAAVTTSPSYLNSPTRVVDETDAPFRRRLDAPCHDMPVLEELRAEGATDYIMFPFPFLDRSRTAVMSFATQERGGFTGDDLPDLELVAKLFSPYVERHVLKRIALDLLDTYVGPRSGSRILEGRILRGQVEQVDAAIWFADLRGFTQLSEEAPIDEVIATLNAWFEEMTELIEAFGGEVLKFIGDAVLAIFPTSGERSRAEACRQAIRAARAFVERSDSINGERRKVGQPPLNFGIALHFGTVAYGNVGAPRRLDFTVIGPAVNQTSRLQDLVKQMQVSVLVSQDVATSAGEPVVDLGIHLLRDVAEPQRVFTLPGVSS